MVSSANFTNYDGMKLAAQNDAAGVPNFSATATSWCQDSSGTTVSCVTNPSAEAYVKVSTQILYKMIVPMEWLGVPSQLKLTGSAIIRTQ